MLAHRSGILTSIFHHLQIVHGGRRWLDTVRNVGIAVDVVIQTPVVDDGVGTGATLVANEVLRHRDRPTPNHGHAESQPRRLTAAGARRTSNSGHQLHAGSGVVARRSNHAVLSRSTRRRRRFRQQPAGEQVRRKGPRAAAAIFTGAVRRPTKHDQRPTPSTKLIKCLCSKLSRVRPLHATQLMTATSRPLLDRFHNVCVMPAGCHPQP